MTNPTPIQVKIDTEVMLTKSDVANSEAASKASQAGSLYTRGMAAVAAVAVVGIGAYIFTKRK